MMASVILVFSLMLLDVSILSTATPKITSDFHSLQNVGWYGAAYQLASATLQPLTWKVYSNFSTKWTFFVFFLIFELGSLLCGVSTPSNMLIVSRAVADMGASGLANGALTMIAVSVPMRKRSSMMGVMIGCSQLGLVGGPLFGELLTQYVSWRWCFYINLPFGGAVAALLLFLHVPEQVANVRAECDALHILEGMIAKLEGVVVVLETEEAGLYSRYSQLYRSLRPTSAAKLGKISFPAGAAATGPNAFDELGLGKQFDMDLFLNNHWPLGWPPADGTMPPGAQAIPL